MKSADWIREQKVKQKRERVYESETSRQRSIISNVGMGDNLTGISEHKRGRKKGSTNKYSKRRR